MKKFVYFAGMIFPAVLLTFTTVHAETAAKNDAKVKVLIIDDESKDFYRFEGTAPLLQKTLNNSGNVQTDMEKNAEVLASEKIFTYDVLLLHFKNYKPLKAQKQAQENLVRFVKEGGGLFIFHFACGAFEDWAEFEKLIGRVWEPDIKKCPEGSFHDRYGKFTVRIVNKEHPLAKDLTDFETQDELYHCFKPGSVPMTVLAEATSNQDGKSYPMAFVLQYGKGRVFHTTLGHNAASVSPEGFVKLLIHAVLWLGKRSLLPDVCPIQEK
ncbi:MAG: ThuA domain-containing protein [Planctomycetaceae bacterium]|jgi:type 1 glutamine amidotransferase|nr:ThuA domain-containing protein [Planctomycetaceae bacterium]